MTQSPVYSVSSPLAPRYVTTTFVFPATDCFAILMTCRYAAPLAGLKPAMNLLVLLMPVPVESAPGAVFAVRLVLAKYWSCHHANGSYTLIKFVIVAVADPP